MLGAAQRVSDIRTYERTANFRRKYEDIDMPAGLAVIGDGVCAFNPVYGQGMSVAVLEAISLGRELATALPPKAGNSDANVIARAASARTVLPQAVRRFMRRISEVLSVPWALATGTDAPFLPGYKPSPVEAAIDVLFNAVARLSQTDQDVHATLMRVMHMLEPPTALVSPRMLLRLALDKLLRAVGARPPRAA